MASKKLNRREFLRIAALSAAGTALAGCATPTPETVTEVVEKTVEVPVEKTVVVKETAVATPTPNLEPTVRPGGWIETFPKVPKRYDGVQISRYFPANLNFLEGDDETNNPATRRLKEQLGLEYTIWSQGGSEAYRADIAANNLPDMWNTDVNDMTMFVENGAVLDITDIWESTATALTKEKKRYPDGLWWDIARFDGRIYGIPFWWGPAYNTEMLGYVRTDWLEQVGMDVPTTLGEMEAVMRAFIDAGLAETGISFASSLLSWGIGADPLFGAYGGMPKVWAVGGDGDLVYGTTRTAVRDALEHLARWYADGLIDPDYYSKGVGQAMDMAVQEKIGMWFAPWWAYAGSLGGKLRAANDSAQFSYMPLPEGPNGDRGRSGSHEVGPCIVFNANSDPIKVEAAIAELNFMIDLHANMDQYNAYGEVRNGDIWVEGYEYIWYGNELKPGPMPETWKYLNGVSMQFPFSIYPEYQAEAYATFREWMELDPNMEMNAAQRYITYSDKNRMEAEAYTRVFEEGDEVTRHMSEFFGNWSEDMAEVWEDANTVEREALAAFITGERPVAEFDAFVAEWSAAGGDVATEEVNKWWAEKQS